MMSGCWSAPSRTSGDQPTHFSDRRNGLQGPEGSAVHPSHLISHHSLQQLSFSHTRASGPLHLLLLLPEMLSSPIPALLPAGLRCLVTFLGRPSLATLSKIATPPPPLLHPYGPPWVFSIRHAMFSTFLSIYLECPLSRMQVP